MCIKISQQKVWIKIPVLFSTHNQILKYLKHSVVQKIDHWYFANGDRWIIRKTHIQGPFYTGFEYLDWNLWKLLLMLVCAQSSFSCTSVVTSDHNITLNRLRLPVCFNCLIKVSVIRHGSVEGLRGKNCVRDLGGGFISVVTDVSDWPSKLKTHIFFLLKW